MRLARLLRELFVEQRRGLVDEGAGPEHDLHGVRARELPAGTRGAALVRDRGRRQVAREAALESDEACEVCAQHELLEVALDEHLHGLFAEALIEALRRRILGARGRDERARGGRRMQAKREPGAGERDDERGREHTPRPPRRSAGERR